MRLVEGEAMNERECEVIEVREAEARVFALAPTRPDAEHAAELKAKIAEAMRPVCALMDEAAQAGFFVRWAGVNPGIYGRHEVQDLHLVKRF